MTIMKIPVVERWEYMGAWANDWPAAFRAMNERGSKGWELVQHIHDASGHMLIFKKRYYEKAPSDQAAKENPGAN